MVDFGGVLQEEMNFGIWDLELEYWSVGTVNDQGQEGHGQDKRKVTRESGSEFTPSTHPSSLDPYHSLLKSSTLKILN